MTDKHQLKYDQSHRFLVLTKPFIFIPGMGASVLDLEDSLDWNVWGLLIVKLFPGKHDEKQFRALYSSDRVRAYDVLTFYYGKFISGSHRRGYTTCTLEMTTDGNIIVPQKIKNPTGFILPYDWRRSNEESADILVKSISKIRQSMSACHQKVPFTLICHSMGGIFARLAVEMKNLSNKEVDEIITIGTPHNGSVESLYPIFKIQDKLPVLSKEQEHNLSMKWDSVYQMLPSIKCIQYEDKLLDIEEFIYRVKDIYPIQYEMFHKNKKIYYHFKNNNYRSDINYIMIGSNSDATTEVIKVSKNNDYDKLKKEPFLFDITEKKSGDGTVLVSSSLDEKSKGEKVYVGKISKKIIGKHAKPYSPIPLSQSPNENQDGVSNDLHLTMRLGHNGLLSHGDVLDFIFDHLEHVRPNNIYGANKKYGF